MVLKAAAAVLKKATKKPKPKKEKEIPYDWNYPSKRGNRRLSQLDAVNKAHAEKLEANKKLPLEERNPFLTKKELRSVLREDRDNPEAYRYTGKLRGVQEKKKGGVVKKKVVKRGR